MPRHTTASLSLEDRGAFRRVPSIRSPPSPHRLGIRCEVADVCADAPCRHGGKCTYYSNNKSFACECRNTGYRGSLCEIDIDECTRNGLRGLGYGERSDVEVSDKGQSQRSEAKCIRIAVKRFGIFNDYL